MTQFAPQFYGPVLAPLVDVDRRRPLGPGVPNMALRDALDALTMEQAFGGKSIADLDMATCVISAVWLLHDFLDQSHSISQSIGTTSGSFWHGIMHRREGDFSNAKYWFRNVGRHRTFDRLAARAAELAERAADSDAADLLAAQRDWDPFAFIDLCEAATRGRQENVALCIDVQQAEWELLFDNCYRAAVGMVPGE